MISPIIDSGNQKNESVVWQLESKKNDSPLKTRFFLRGETGNVQTVHLQTSRRPNIKESVCHWNEVCPTPWAGRWSYRERHLHHHFGLIQSDPSYSHGQIDQEDLSWGLCDDVEWNSVQVGKDLTFDFVSDPLVHKSRLVTVQCGDSIITFSDMERYCFDQKDHLDIQISDCERWSSWFPPHTKWTLSVIMSPSVNSKSPNR